MVYGKTHQQLQAEHEENLKKLREWKKVFAWLPVQLPNGQKAWLEWVEVQTIGETYRYTYYRRVGETSK